MVENDFNLIQYILLTIVWLINMQVNFLSFFKIFSVTLELQFICKHYYKYLSCNRRHYNFRLESKLDDFNQALNDISKAQERFKRNSEFENHVLTKRQVQSNVRLKNISINKSKFVDVSSRNS